MAYNESETRFYLIDPVLRAKGQVRRRWSHPIVGFVAIMAQPMATSQDFANWVCGGDVDPEYLMYALICSGSKLRELATGATHKTIYMPTLEAFHLCAPAVEEQRRIAARLKSQLAEVEKARQAAEMQLREINALPGRLLAQAFQDAS